MDVTVDNPKNAWRTELAGPSPAEAALAAVKAVVIRLMTLEARAEARMSHWPAEDGRAA